MVMAEVWPAGEEPAAVVIVHTEASETTYNGRLEVSPDLEPDRTDSDREHPVAPVQGGHATLKCRFGLLGGA